MESAFQSELLPFWNCLELFQNENKNIFKSLNGHFHNGVPRYFCKIDDLDVAWVGVPQYMDREIPKILGQK